MLTCKQASALVSQSLDRRLPWRQRAALRLHLLLCDACRRFKRQAEFLHAAVRSGGARLMALSPAARERIRFALRKNDT
jgi:hypothetical protein